MPCSASAPPFISGASTRPPAPPCGRHSRPPRRSSPIPGTIPPHHSGRAGDGRGRDRDDAHHAFQQALSPSRPKTINTSFRTDPTSSGFNWRPRVGTPAARSSRPIDDSRGRTRSIPRPTTPPCSSAGKRCLATSPGRLRTLRESGATSRARTARNSGIRRSWGSLGCFGPGTRRPRGQSWLRRGRLSTNTPRASPGSVPRIWSRSPWRRRGWAVRPGGRACRRFAPTGLVGVMIESAPFNQALTFVAIGKAQAKAGDRVGARDSAREAIAVVGKIHEEGYRPTPLSQACDLLRGTATLRGPCREAATLIRSQRLGPLRTIEAEQRKAGDEAVARSAAGTEGRRG